LSKHRSLPIRRRGRENLRRNWCAKPMAFQSIRFSCRLQSNCWRIMGMVV